MSFASEFVARFFPDNIHTSSGWSVRCPAHEDHNPSLAIAEGDNGGVILNCFTGCKTLDICKALNINLRDLFPPETSAKGHTNGKPKKKKPVRVFKTAKEGVEAWEAIHGPRTKLWTYFDGNNKPVAVVVRFPDGKGGKLFKPVSLYPDGWHHEHPPAPRLLYNFPKLKDAETVYVAEGEKCADAVSGLGFIATTSPAGANAARFADWSVLRGKNVIVLADYGTPGEKYAQAVADLVQSENLKIINLPGLTEGEDVVEWLDRGGTKEQLLELIDQTPAYKPPAIAITSEEGPIKPIGIATDHRRAERVLERHGLDLRYCHPWKSWLCWNGQRYLDDDLAGTEQRIKETCRFWLKQTLDSFAEKKLSPFANKPENTEHGILIAQRNAVTNWEDSRTLRRCMEQMKSEPNVPILPCDLDKDQYKLNLKNGTLDLRTMTLGEHRREDLITKLAPVNYESTATAPRWLEFLDRIMEGNKDLIGYLQRACGLALTGDAREQCLFFLYGSGANGKSTFLNTILAMMGDYGGQAVSELLMARSSEAHPTERADLAGKRMIATVEIDEGKKMAEAIIKQLTGGEKLKARRMRQDFFEIDQTWKIFLAANHKPIVQGDDLAIWRRIKLIPFNVTIAEDERDAELQNKLKDELPGILNWCLEGFSQWKKSGLGEPDEVRSAVAEYKFEQDQLGAFIKEACFTSTESTEARCQSSALFDAYVRFSSDKNMSQTAFSKKMSSKGFSKKMGGDGRMYWLGISLTAISSNGYMSQDRGF